MLFHDATFGFSLGFSVLSGPLFAAPLFENSVVSIDLEFIKSTAPTLFACLKQPQGRQLREIPDRRSDKLFANAL